MKKYKHFMRTIITLLALVFFIESSLGQKIPEIEKTVFSEMALRQTLTDSLGNKVTVKEIINKHKGKIIVLKLWAGWCRDCLIGMEAAHELNEKNPELDFIYFSLDKNSESWKKGIIKYNLETVDNYWFDSGWKNDFNTYIDLNWIPRYMVIDQKGDIAKYYAISAEDIQIQEILQKLKEE